VIAQDEPQLVRKLILAGTCGRHPTPAALLVNLKPDDHVVQEPCVRVGPGMQVRNEPTNAADFDVARIAARSGRQQRPHR
jgi:hypothetical protein